MEVILLQNTVFNSLRYRAGETLVVSEELGQKLIGAELAVAVPQIDDEPVVVDVEAVEPVKKPARRTTKKVAQG